MVDHNNTALPADRATHEPNPQAVSSVPVGIPSAMRDITESGDFYIGTPANWAKYRAAVDAGDWDEVMRFETGFVEGFSYAP